jgi:hypothetical protein
VHRCCDSSGIVAEVIDQPPIERAWAHVRWKLTPEGAIVGAGGTMLRGEKRIAELRAWAECAARQREPVQGRLRWSIVDVSVTIETHGFAVQWSAR